MAGTVFLKTNCFEVKLEGITFKSKDFEELCMMDFLFPDGKIWDHPPVVGLDVMCHPRDPTVLLILLCFGVGCVILRFRRGEELPPPILRFLTDQRIRFVGFGIPEKKDLFPFEKLGLSKSKVDIGYLASDILKDPKYKRCQLAQLARKVLGIKRMTGLTEASSFERHEQIKCAICQLFITSIIAMGLLSASHRKKSRSSGSGSRSASVSPSPKRSSFLKNLNSLSLLKEGWFKFPKVKKDKQKSQFEEDDEYTRVEIREPEDLFGEINDPVKTKWDDEEAISKFLEIEKAKLKEELKNNEECWNGNLSDYSKKDVICTPKKPLKGILKCPSSGLKRSLSTPMMQPENFLSEDEKKIKLKRANSKGCNVTFKCQ